MLRNIMLGSTLLSSAALFAAPDEGQATGDIGDRMNALASQLAAIETEHLDGAIETVVQAKHDWQGGPVKVMIAASQDYSDEELEQFPDPDVKTGNNPSEFKLKRPGDKTARTVNFYNLFADQKAKGKAISKELEYLTRAGNDKMKQDDIPDNIKAMNADQRDQRRKYLEGAKQSFRSAIKDGFKLFFKLQAVNGLPGVEAFIVPGINEGEYENLVHVNTTVEGRQTLDYENMSLTSFMKLNVGKAMENGGTYAALIATKKRNVEPPPPSEEGAKPVHIATLDTFKARFTDIHSYMDTVWTAKDKAVYMELLKTLGPRGPAGSDDIVKSMYSVFQMLKDVFSEEHAGILKRAEDLHEAEITGGEAPAEKKTGTK
jgi:hypothetical protein